MMISRHGYLSNSPRHSNDLQKYSRIKKRCYCLRGSTKSSNCFGPWDHQALEIPPGTYHVSDGKFLLSDLKQQPAVSQRKILPSLVKCPKRGYGSTVSLGYLSRSCTLTDERWRFRHFVTVTEHIRHYRENKPNSLYEPTEQEQETVLQHGGMQHASMPVDDICRCAYCNSTSYSAPTGDHTPCSKKGPNKSCVCTEHPFYCHPQPIPLKATGKSVLPTHPNLIMPPPSLEDMSDTFWVPVNAVFQRRQVTTMMYNSMGYYDHISVKFPSLRKKPFGEEFPRPKKKITAKKKIESGDTCGELLYRESAAQTDRGVPSEQKCPCGRAEVSMTTHRPFAGPGRLLSGKLKPTLPNHQENLDSLVIGIKKSTLSNHPDCNMVIGVHKSPYEIPSSNRSTSTKRSTEISATVTPPPMKKEDSLDGSTAGPVVTKAPGTSAQVSKRILTKPQSPREPEPELNEFNITCENCRRERLLEDSTILDSPIINSSPVELNLDTEREKSNRLSSRMHHLSQDHLYKPTNVSITFKKPMKLFRVRSVQKKMLQHDHSKQPSRNSDNHQHREMKSGEQRPLKSSRHRSALNKREGSGHTEGVFGTQKNHHMMSCVLRSREGGN